MMSNSQKKFHIFINAKIAKKIAKRTKGRRNRKSKYYVYMRKVVRTQLNSFKIKIQGDNKHVSLIVCDMY